VTIGGKRGFDEGAIDGGDRCRRAAAAMLPGTVQAAASEDPRLSGNRALVEGCDDEWDVSQANVHIENDVGSWSGSEAYRFDLDLPTEGTWGFGLRGEGGYEGLTAILFFMGGGDEEPYRQRYAGLIFPGTLPPATVPDCPSEA
jgi:hypothetical protein